MRNEDKKPDLSPVPRKSQDLQGLQDVRSANLSRRGLEFLVKRKIQNESELVYRQGTQTSKSVTYREVAGWFRDAESGKAGAQYNIGVMYFKGVGVQQN